MFVVATVYRIHDYFTLNIISLSFDNFRESLANIDCSIETNCYFRKTIQTTSILCYRKRLNTLLLEAFFVILKLTEKGVLLSQVETPAWPTYQRPEHIGTRIKPKC